MRIEDFGEKIGGARKDLWIGRGLGLEDLDCMNEAERNHYVTRDNVWPLPDAKKLIAEGADKFIVYWQREVRRHIRKIPDPMFGLSDQGKIFKAQEQYIMMAGTIRDTAMAVKSEEDIQKFYEASRSHFADHVSYYITVDDKLNRTWFCLGRLRRKMIAQNFPEGKKKTVKRTKINFVPKQLDSVNRIGPTCRLGHVGPEIWQKEFSFRGVESVAPQISEL